MAEPWLAIYDVNDPSTPVSLAPTADVDTAALHPWLAWVPFDGPPSSDLRWDPTIPAMVPATPPPPIAGADNLPRWVYTTDDGAIRGAGTTEAIPAAVAALGATEAHYLATYPEATQHWDPATRAYVGRPPPHVTLEDTLIRPLVAQQRDLLALKEVATAAGAPTARLDARLAEIATDLALLAGAYDTAPDPA